jgi:transcriptional regulator with XRE-family HTH domain
VSIQRPIEIRFGESVRRHRRARGLSQEALAELADLHRTFVGSVEQGHRNLSLRNIERLALALGMSPGQLMTDVDREA